MRANEDGDQIEPPPTSVRAVSPPCESRGDPADFGCFGADQQHFCLLARIETANTAPFGMSTAEGINVFTNTRNNNNIVWKNISVVDDLPGERSLASVLIRNIFREPTLTRLRFLNTAGDAGSFFRFGRIEVDLGPELFKRWRDAGGAGQGIEVVGPTTVAIENPDAFIQGLPLGPGEAFSLDVRFQLDLAYEPQHDLRPTWDLIQLGAPGDPDALVGGQRFSVDLSKIALVPAGGEWRYLSDGSAPGPDWALPGFDDSGWASGSAELGFGDDPITSIDGGPDGQRHPTVYFRRSFAIDDLDILRDLLLQLKRDDGAVVYLNGSEVYRTNMPAGDPAHETRAERTVDGLEEELFFPIRLPDGLQLLRTGRNVIAVEVHQDGPDSPDLSFDLELGANYARENFPPAVGFAAPGYGELLQAGEELRVDVEALDGDGAVASVSLFADGELIGTDSTGPYSFPWQGAGLGAHQLRAVAQDAGGERATAEIAVVVVENRPPSVELTAPSGDTSFAAGEVIRVSAQASDPGGAVARVDYHLHNAELFGAPMIMPGGATEPPYAVDVRGLAPGRYMLMAVATDDGGATAESVPIQITVEAAEQLFLPQLFQ